MERFLGALFPPHQAYLDSWLGADPSGGYTPTADGMRLYSNGHDFFETLFSDLCHPEPAPTPPSAPAPGATSTPAGTPAILAPSPTPSMPSPTPSMPSPTPSTPSHSLSECRSPSPQPAGHSTLSTEAARELIAAYVRRAPWLEAQADEALVGDADVPRCALQLARPGESVYRCFVDSGRDRRGQPVYTCSACPFKSDRLHRVVGHQRSKRGHRPFVCPDQGCDFRGYSAESLGDHRSGRNGLQTCERCGDTIVRKNMARHIQVMHEHVY